MKKKPSLFSTKSNKKNSTMTNNNLSAINNGLYIYTEADLGEGILDEGVDPSFYASANEHVGTSELAFSFKSIAEESKSYGLEIINVEEDFNYAYYL